MLLGLYLKFYVFEKGIELYLPDSFLQLSEIKEIISALCSIACIRTALFFNAICSALFIT